MRHGYAAARRVTIRFASRFRAHFKSGSGPSRSDGKPVEHFRTLNAVLYELDTFVCVCVVNLFSSFSYSISNLLSFRFVDTTP